MRVLLSTIGSRGELQPVAALASRLRALGHDVLVCAPPNFRAWLAGMGIPAIPLGPSIRPAPGTPPRWDLSTPDGRRHAAEDAVATQFATLPGAAEDRDILLGCGLVQVAAHSVAELLGIGYVHAEFCPASLPSPHHPPAPWPGWPRDETGTNARRWAADAQRWNDVWGPALNDHRASLGLPAVDDVRGHVLTGRPWLAADPTLSPWPGDTPVFQTGAWTLPDDRPLPAGLATFLDAGDPPVYFGLGSYAGPGGEVSRAMVTAARALGRRSVISSGWAELPLPDDGDDCFLVGEANHQALFRRVAAVVHHGGAGTTTTAARAGATQVVIPQQYDQFYWAERVNQLGIGAAHRPGTPTAESLTDTLTFALEPDVAGRARAVATAMGDDGTRTAASGLLDHFTSAGR
ncbi:glycosyltransferase [Amycolatopsis suaedae]|uniref:Glycosyltransferase n=1 Tax=Amycolatopsis suaedae TaxID=2510978 RepID=A0A4Q7J895_9PSEU|nr:glycosyltransferase [Amycolatopsis suaedae]RZQ63052.1 glycosyltransferase [Amycolatopsis suaedae]